ncbi:BTAD domain-containing putative transcriptional regulator [Thermopolyspora sp. NPDC052614]|uniref:BTAD domain-containing putative transcriptional regulator n=1 Tax=Thermopolyspora sp. NPDC052614 TaxID=3155682 RepID=UPI00344621EE
MPTEVSFAILGPLEVRRDGQAVEIGGQRLRALLALLLLTPGRTVPTQTLISGVWEDRPPSGVGNALQALVSRLRAALRADRGLVVAEPHGYRLSVPPGDVDAHAFARLARAGRAALGDGDAARAAATLREALRLWRGPALPELSGTEVGGAEIARLEQLRLAAIEDRVEADLRLGAHDGLPAEITRLIAAHPLRERLRGQLMRALYESGRQVEALAAYEEARAYFADRLGADPSPELAELHLAMLRREHKPPTPPRPPHAVTSGPSPASPLPPASLPSPASAPGSAPGSASVPLADSASLSGSAAGSAGVSFPSPGSGSSPASSLPSGSVPSPTSAPGSAPGSASVPPADSASLSGSAAGSAGVSFPSPGSGSAPASSVPSGSVPSPASASASGPGSASVPPAQSASPLGSAAGSAAASFPPPGSGSPFASAPVPSAESVLPSASPTAGPPTPAAVRVGNLRARLTSFVGREQEVERVGRLLAERRLVTLVGPGGAGKTRLAVESADAIGDRMPDGVWLVELAPLRDEVEIPQAVLAALGLRDMTPVASPRGPTSRSPEGGDPVSRLVTLLGARTTLLVLDNCEHLVDGAARLADRLLAECPGVRVLATSREPLGITGETLLTVPPLGLPAPDDPDARESPAVRLFLDRASGVRPGHRIDDPTAVVRICRALDGLPLAIELAAARLRSLSAEQIAARLGDRFRLLTGGSRTALPRHQTLRAVVEWSWELLDEQELRLVRRLAVFAGGATLETIEGVCAGDGLHEDDILDVLARLVDKSLVVMEERDGVPRYRMLETIRAYASERLVEAGEEDRYRLAHARRFLDLATTAEPHLRRHEQIEWLETLSSEHDNLTGALHWAMTAGRAELAAAITGELLWYWWLIGHRAEGARWARAVLRLVRESGASVDPRDLALLYVGFAINGQGAGLPPDEEIRASLEEAARLGREHGHRNPLSMLADPILAVMTWNEELEEPIADLVPHPDPWVRAVARMFRAYLWLNFGRIAEAEPEAEHAVRLFRETGDRWGIGMCLSALAGIHLLRGNFRQAVAVLKETLDLTAAMGNQEDLPHIRCTIAMAVYVAGDRERALAHLEEAERLYEKVRDEVGMSFLHHVRGEIARWEGDLDKARREYATAATAMPHIRRVAPQQVSLVLLGHAFLALEENDLPRAGRLLEDALDGAIESMDGQVLAANAVGAAALALARGEPRKAATMLGVGHRLRGSHDPASLDCVRVVDQTKATLGPAFDTEYERGRALPRDEALALLTADVLAPHVS